MDEDLYKILGVKRNASSQDIQKAYRDLARKYHPDMNPDDRSAKEKFQKVQHAYDILGNPEKREMYDRYGSSFETMGGGPGGGRRTYSAGPGGGFEQIDLEQLFGGGGPGGFEGAPFAELFRQFAGGAGSGRRAGGARPAAGGRNVEHETTIPFQTAVTGGEVRVNVQRGNGKRETISVKIPPGITDGKKVRVRGQGEPAAAPGKPGDLLITVRVAGHANFQRRGNNLEVRVPVTLAEAALGAKIDVPSPRGTIALTVPPGTSSGKRLRAKGQGVLPKDGPAGDLIAVIEIVLPDSLEPADLDLVRELDRRHPLQPRSDLRW